MTVVVWNTISVTLHEKTQDAFSDRYFLENDSDWPCYDSWESPDEDMAVLETEYAAYYAEREAQRKRMRQDDQAKLIGKVLVSDGGDWSAAEWVYDEAKRQSLLDKWIGALGADRVRWEGA